MEFRQTNGLSMSNLYTSPEGLGIVLDRTTWDHEHCGVYPGSSSHWLTYVHTNMDSVAIWGRHRSLWINAYKSFTLATRCSMFQICVNNSLSNQVGGGFTLHDTGSPTAYLSYREHHHYISMMRMMSPVPRWHWTFPVPIPSYTMQRKADAEVQPSSTASKMVSVRLRNWMLVISKYIISL